MSHHVTVEPHRASWEGLFAAEAARIRSALGAALRALHHIGSTAVPGLPAKPIIDLLADVKTLAALDACTDAMQRLGYEAMGEFGIAGRRYFRKSDAAGTRTHQIHAFATGSPHLARHLAFRDYLRAHPEVARKYGALKLHLVATTGGDLEAYIAGKDGLVKEIERQALQWLASAPAPHEP